MNNKIECVSSGAQLARPFECSVFSHFPPPKDADAAFWWQTTGYILAEALQQAEYSLEEQYTYLLFHHNSVVARLGPRPNTRSLSRMWKSFMTDDFSPIEYSWNWGTGSKPPDVRYSIEAIGPEAGLIGDPFNQKMTLDLVDELRSKLPNADWTWFNILRESFQINSSPAGAFRSTLLPSKPSGHSSQSSVFLAFEMQRGRLIVPKAYLVPVRALSTGEPPLSVVSEGIVSLAATDHTLNSSLTAYSHLLHFLTTHPEGRLLSVLFVAVDCVSAPKQSRLKIYLRSPHTSFASVCTILSMGGTLSHLTYSQEYGSTATDNDDLMQDFHDLFHSLLSLDPSEEGPICNKSPAPETEGMLFYFDVAPSSPLPQPKVYIPVKHYARSEKAAMLALRQWLERKGQGKWCKRFQQVVEKIGDGALTYVSVGFERGRLNVTSYLGGQNYSRGEKGERTLLQD